jgi:hypothetical protein
MNSVKLMTDDQLEDLIVHIDDESSMEYKLLMLEYKSRPPNYKPPGIFLKRDGFESTAHNTIDNMTDDQLEDLIVNLTDDQLEDLIVNLTDDESSMKYKLLMCEYKSRPD